eukprot:g3126.t1
MDDGVKSISIIKYLRKFGGREADYADWRYTTLRTIGLHKPDIANLLSGTWSKPKREHDFDDHCEGDRDDDSVRSGAATGGAQPSTTAGEDNENNEDDENDETNDNEAAAVAKTELRIKSPGMDEPVRPPATIPTPATCQKAVRSVDADRWKKAMDKEMISISEHVVADLVTTGKTRSVVQDLKDQLANKFKMTDGGPAKLLLGMEIAQKHGEITVSQHYYVLEILEKFKMQDCKPVSTPGSGPEIEKEPENAIFLDEVETKLYQRVFSTSTCT